MAPNIPHSRKVDQDGYRPFFESAADGMALAGADGRIRDANASACGLLGLKRERVIGSDFEGLFDPGDPHFVAALAQWRKTGRFDGRLLVGRPDGTRFVAEVTLRRDREDTSIIFRSVGEREEFGANASDGPPGDEPSFRALVENAHDFVVLADENNVALYVSPSIEQILGYTPEEFVGTVIAGYGHPDEAEEELRRVAEVLPFPGAHNLGAWRYRRKDGSYCYLEVVVNNKLDDPVLRGVVCNCRDVTERVEFEERLRRSEERFRGLVENAHDFIVLASEENVALYASPSIERVMGYTPEEFVGTIIAQYTHLDDLEAGLANVEETLPEPGPHMLNTIRYRRKDGTYRWLEVVVNNRVDDPALRGVVCNCRDVTERIEAEEQLRESEERYRLLVEQVPAATYIERNDEDSSTVYVSPRIEEMLGYTPEEWTSQPDLWLRTIHPEDHGRVLARHLRCNATREPFDEEYRCVAKDGREVWVRDEAVLVRGGEEPYWQGVKVDITGRKQAELEILRLNTELREQVAGYTAELKAAIESLKEGERHLKEREEQFHATFERAAVGIAHVSPGGRWLRVNEKLCEVLGYERGELLARTFQDITHPEDLENDLAQVGRLLAGEITTYSTEKRYLRKDGSTVWAELNVSLVRSSDGEPEYFISVIEDVTRRKGAEAILKALSPREIEILGEVVQGRTNAEIAQSMSFSANTIKGYVKSITEKLGAADRTQAAVYAAETSLFDSEFPGPGP